MSQIKTFDTPPQETGNESATGRPAYPPEPVVFPLIEPAYRHRPKVNWLAIIFGALAAASLIVSGWVLFLASPDQHARQATPGFVLPASSTPSATPTAASTSQVERFVLVRSTFTPTPVPGGRILVLTSAAQDVGWVSSDDDIITDYDPQNHFGDSFLYAGVLAGKVYHAAIQFDLSRIPRGTKVYAASLRLTGLRADQLNQQGHGTWQVQILSPEIDYNWRSHNYEQIHLAASWSSLEPLLTQEELGEGRVNLFEFTPGQIALLERRILEGGDRSGRQISFRLDGPAEGGDNLFAWDGGSGPASQGAGPELFLSLGPPPLEPPPPYYVVVTSTPTPENVLTAAANSLRMTAEATRLGTATPLPPYWVTPTVVTATPTPANQATAQAMGELATAIALTTGEPLNVVTATPTPTRVIITSTPTAPTTGRPLNVVTATPTPTRVIITSTPTAPTTGEPLNVVTATPTPTRVIITSTPTALTTGKSLNVVTATPTPTRVIITSTPTLANRATAEHLRAIVLATDTPTPVAVMQTATPPPAFSAFTGTLTLINPVTLDPPSYGPTDFEWGWPGPAPAGLGFEVRIWREGNPPMGAHDAVLDNQNGNIKSIGENKYRLSIDIQQAAGVQGRSGEYLWTVALVQIIPNYEDLGQQALPAHLRFETLAGGSEKPSQSGKGGDTPTTR